MQTATATIPSAAIIQKEPVVYIDQLKKTFGDNEVLCGFDLNLYPGESVVVLGKSGSGKSVLIKCIIGLLEPDAGYINVLGEDVLNLDADALDRLRVKVGFLFQSNALYDSMTVRENLEFPLRRHWLQVAQQEVDAMVMEALENVGLPETADMLPIELSGGMRKRIALARMLMLRPEILLYDEPTTGLDTITGREISELMIAMQQKYKTTSLIISHDMKCIQRTADRVVVLINGRCYAQGSFADLQRSGDSQVKQFFE